MQNRLLPAIASLCLGVFVFSLQDPLIKSLAGTYPVSGRWGQSTSTEKGPIDCSKLRVISFSGNQRTDSNSGANEPDVVVTPNVDSGAE